MNLWVKGTPKDRERVVQELIKIKYTCNFLKSLNYTKVKTNILLVKYNCLLGVILLVTFNQEIQL